jgi:hypothetical protein
MTELQPGTRVRTATVLSAQDWSPDQNKLRQPGVDGTIRAVHTTSDDSELWYEVAHGAVYANYSAHELTPIRERAREAAAPTPERERLKRLEQRLTAAETEHQRFVGTIAVELVTLEQRIERAEDSERVYRRGADRLEAEAAVAAARNLCELGEKLAPILEWLQSVSSAPYRQDVRAVLPPALEAIPAMLRRIEQPLLEIAAARTLEGNLHRELLERLSPERIGLLCDWLEQAGDELGQSTLAELLHDLLPAPDDDEPELAQPVQDDPA